ncbi:SMP-30/gluconolactonase/LRE family protein [Maribacter polysiphoniae]|uniref:Sugar lactone lactonase YvrE n=2 Tax=Maribacter polysiphoniae TaxID=429344 RepID=A0A316DYS1_9FLAO|nr:SMP-30/gluconolactonase/LRE family protein [Maribacter polysiphoniae]PWK22578.1 sugar lactone lactonase YvrE [Maribacter polysiphoniae]
MTYLIHTKSLTLAILMVIGIYHVDAQQKNLKPAKLFVELPSFCPTPDAFDIAPDGSLVLSCPNFADRTLPGILVKIDKDKKITKLLEIPGVIKDRNSNPMGIAYAPDGSLFVCNNQGKNQGQVLCITFDGKGNHTIEIVAEGMGQPNGIRYHDGAVYVTQPAMPKIRTENHVSGLYRFKTSDRNIFIKNDKSDSNLIYITETINPDRKVGLDGLVFNKAGELFVGDFGDGELIKLILDEEGKVTKEELFANVPKVTGIDGINTDSNDNIYVAGFCQNQILKVDLKGNVTLIADYDDNDGANGQIDQPADIIVYMNNIIISNFDLMSGEGIINSKHSKPYTLSYIKIY